MAVEILGLNVGLGIYTGLLGISPDTDIGDDAIDVDEDDDEDEDESVDEEREWNVGDGGLEKPNLLPPPPPPIL